MKRIIVFILLLFLLSGGLCRAGSGINGTWKINYRLCLYYNDTLVECEKGKSNYIVSKNKLYVGSSKVGTAKKSGKKVTFAYDYDYMKTSLEAAFQNAGAKVTVEEASLSFSGTVRKNTIKNGKIKGTIILVFESTGGNPTPRPTPRRMLEPSQAEPNATPEPRVSPVPGVTYTIKYSGKFTAKKLKGGRNGRSLKELHDTEENYSNIIDTFDYSKLHP